MRTSSRFRRMSVLIPDAGGDLETVKVLRCLGRHDTGDLNWRGSQMQFICNDPLPELMYAFRKATRRFGLARKRPPRKEKGPGDNRKETSAESVG